MRPKGYRHTEETRHKISQSRMGQDNPNWKGGRSSKTRGYVTVRVYPENFFYPMAESDGYILEHRLVMAKYLNRCLLPWEIVHHKNGIRNDNRLENLKLLPSQTYHTVDTLLKSKVTKLEKRIQILEKRIILLEAENLKLNLGLERNENKCIA